MAAVVLETMRKRAEFLAVRGGSRWSAPAFVLETKERRSTPDDLPCPAPGARFGFTITKKIGNAVVRNKIRRRLKAALEPLVDRLAQPSNDYVVVARRAAFDIPFATLQKDLERALQRVHHAGAGHRSKRRT